MFVNIPKEKTKKKKTNQNNSGKVSPTTVDIDMNWRQSLGQRFNWGGIVEVLGGGGGAERGSLAIPHLSVPDIRWIDWKELERLGFRGVVFDKDNTLTAPYSLSLWPSLSHSLRQCLLVFPGRVAIFSNSAGLYEYDPDGSHAKALEESIGGVHVIRHGIKKPAGSAEDIEKYFGYAASHVIMVGDRHFTDIIYGNRNGLLTILTEPLSLSEDPFIIQQVRKLETYLVTRWHQQGLKPPNHSLLQENMQCIKAPDL
ncbi:hypothetical protein QJS10_CPB22g01177 [Acorus calamus]|uniref:Uncharacterized protein n=1 Tax=Acorus calamus TaxID=4465 RepID=A0AAV9C1R2_ACOCL|nr:hypothetical protein QJS10_CPB22g01177 [Acorus calamus]